MRSYDVRAQSSADAATVYAAMIRGATWPLWSPIDSFEVEGGSPDGVQGIGAVRVFRTGKNVSREQIVELETNSHLGYVILPGGFLHDYRGDIEVSANSSGGTDIRWRGKYNLKLVGIGWLFERYLSGFMQKCANGLAAYASESPTAPRENA